MSTASEAAVTEVYGSSTVKRSRSTRAELVAVDDAIIAAVEAEHPVTLRGVFYRVVSAGAIDKTENGYRRIGRELLKLRRTGAIRYDWITDGTRWVNKPDSYDDLDQMLEDAAASYRRALWRDQAAEVHIYSEKDAISGVVLPVTHRWDVPLGIVRGYSSESFAWSVAQSIIGAAHRGKDTYVYQLGDHDPSGVDAWRAFRKTVCGFLMEEHLDHMAQLRRSHPEASIGEVADPDGSHCGSETVCAFVAGDKVRSAIFDRLAVTEFQITQLGLPTRPTKQTDSRKRAFGDGESVEVDAIAPTVLRQIVEDAITQHIDAHQLEITQVYERSEREVLTGLIGGRQ